MNVTLAMVLDMLSGHTVTKLFSKDSPFVFTSVKLLTPSEKLDPQTLYVGSPAQFKLMRAPALAEVCVVCIGKREYFEKYLQRRSANLLLLPEDADLFTVANRLFSSFEQLSLWESEFQQAILQEQSYQDLAELGGRLFGENPVVIVNASYNLLGCSVQSAPNNERLSSLLETGYFPKDVTDIFARMGYSAHLEIYRHPQRIDPPNYMGCPLFMLIFESSGGIAIGFMTVYFLQDAPTEGQFDLFKYFSVQVRDYYLQRLHRDFSVPTRLELFMVDLIEHTREEESYLIDRARSLELPLDTEYRLGIIQWDHYAISLAHYVMGRLNSTLHFPSFKILRYQQSVLLLLRGDMPSLKVLQEVSHSFEEFSNLLKDSGGYVGFSSITASLLKMDVAYRQACAAVKYGKQLAPEHSIHFYSRFYIYEMLDLYAGRYSLDDMFIQKLRLLQKPEEGYYSNLYLLRNYLLTERSLSATAKLLHMHRNSVIYRLGKIRETLGVDLDDPDVRLRLLISFKVLEMLDGHIQPPLELGSDEDKALPVYE